MAGIAGFYGEHLEILDMRDKLLVSECLTTKQIYQRDKFAYTCVDLLDSNIGYIENSNISVFVYGDCYNLLELNKLFEYEENKFETILLRAYKENILPKVLNKVDGIFSAIIYDHEKSKIFLISDRWGVLLMYWYCKGENFIFSSSVESIISNKNLNLSLDDRSIKCFCDLGFCLGENTYFNEIKLIKPASILSYDINTNTVNQTYYWKFSEIQQQDISFEDAVDKLSNLLQTSFIEYSHEPQNIILPLSGGLDSRLILAALMEKVSKDALYVYTFGDKGSLDIEYARKCCKKFKIKQHIYDIYENGNWFEKTVAKIPIYSGMLSMQHYHGINAILDIRKHGKYVYSGFAGDAVLGGTFKYNNNYLDKRINEEIARDFYKEYYDLANIDDDFYNIPHCEANLYMNRVRRFTTMGLSVGYNYFKIFVPFYSNKIMEFIFSIPDKYRQNNKLYATVLLKTFPKLFKSIPWQKTEESITKLVSRNKFNNKNKILKELKNYFDILLKKKSQRDFADYNNYIEEPNIKKQIMQILMPQENKSLVSNYINIEELFKIQDQRLRVSKILIALTVELYLQRLKTLQVLNV